MEVFLKGLNAYGKHQEFPESLVGEMSEDFSRLTCEDLSALYIINLQALDTRTN